MTREVCISAVGDAKIMPALEDVNQRTNTIEEIQEAVYEKKVY